MTEEPFSPELPLGLGRIDTPLGPMLLAFDRAGRLVAAEFEDTGPRMRQLLARRFPKAPPELVPAPVPGRLSGAFARYFAGEVAALAGLATAPAGTPFQLMAWAALCAIPPGKSASYGAQAERIGRPGAARAIGRANALNPLALVVPCHRLIGAAGALTGYAGGLWRKDWLLAHEARHAPPG